MARSLTGTLLRGAGRGVTAVAPVPLTPRTGRSGFGSGLLRGGPGGIDTALSATTQSGRLYAIVNRLATGTAGLNWHLYEKAASGKPEDRREITRHPALNVWQQWNPFTSREEGVEISTQHLDLTGEFIWVIGRDPRAAVPLELWPVRPDRMTPVPHPTKYLAGWIYSSPDGEQVPLELDAVIQVRTPNPADPYRGLAPVQAIMTDVQSLQYAREWNRNFFLNSAEPGGIIEFERPLGDVEWAQHNARWREQHQGVAQAHRVATIEGGKWVDRKMSQRDMEFSSLQGLSTEAIRDAYGFPRPSLGDTQDVNRANAEAADVLLAKHLLVPRGNRIRGALNNQFLKLFGDASRGLEFDFDSPVPADEAAENAARDSKVRSFIDLTTKGHVTPASASEYLDLPVFEVKEPDPVPPALAQPVPGAPAVPVPPVPAARARLRFGDEPTMATPAEPSPSQAALDAATAAVLAAWAVELVQVRARIVANIRALVEAGDRAGLAALTSEADALAAALASGMTGLAATAAGQVVAEAAAQGVSLGAGIADAATLQGMAEAHAALYVRDLQTGAAREALRVWGPASTPAQVADHVEGQLGALTDATPARTIVAGLVQAEGHGRAATLAHGPVGSIYAKERRDTHSCGPCNEIDGRFLGTTDDLQQVFITHPNGSQYIGCLGRDRCRGEIEGVWRKGTGQ